MQTTTPPNDLGAMARSMAYNKEAIFFKKVEPTICELYSYELIRLKKYLKALNTTINSKTDGHTQKQKAQLLREIQRVNRYIKREEEALNNG